MTIGLQQVIYFAIRQISNGRARLKAQHNLGKASEDCKLSRRDFVVD